MIGCPDCAQLTGGDCGNHFSSPAPTPMPVPPLGGLVITPLFGPRPYCCPVCNGAGTVSRPPWVAGDVPSWPAADNTLHACRPCGGTGVLWR